MPKPEPFPRRLRRLREAAGLTREQFATRAGVSYAALRQWEAGTRCPSLAAAGKLSQALGVCLLCAGG